MNFIPHSTYSSRAIYTRWIGMALGATTLVLEVGLVLWQLVTGHLQFRLRDTIIFLAILCLGGFVVFVWHEYTSYLDIGNAIMNEPTPAQQSGENPANTEGRVSETTSNPGATDPTYLMEGAPEGMQSQREPKDTPGARSPAVINEIKLIQEISIQKNPFPTIRSFVFPKEGYNPEHSQDKFAFYIDESRCRIALADGVSTSFLPSSWAQIITNNFIERSMDFRNPVEFTEWLNNCSQQWYRWVDEVWIPAINQQQGRKKRWSHDRSIGAQTTLIGCSFSPQSLLRDGSTLMNVSGLGDTVFFLVHPPKDHYGAWQQTAAFFCTSPDDFGPIPETLATAESYIEQAWTLFHRGCCTASMGDYIFLATDALAKWIVTRAHMGQPPWPDLLKLTQPETFRNFVLQERANRSLEVDDTTLLIIHLQ